MMELKPCPFCGGKATISTDTVREYNTWETLTFVKCTKCHVKTGYFGLKINAMIAWNRRCDI